MTSMFVAVGKQVLRGGEHFADAVDNGAAAAIVAALSDPLAPPPDDRILIAISDAAGEQFAENAKKSDPPAGQMDPTEWLTVEIRHRDVERLARVITFANAMASLFKRGDEHFDEATDA